MSAVTAEVPTSIPLPSGLLRPLRPGDVASLARHANDEGVWAHLRDRFPHPYTEEDARAWLEVAQGQPVGTHFAIDVGGEAIGSVGLVLQSDVHRRSAELGYWLGRAFWGRGIATEVVRAVTTHAFEAYGLVRVFAVVFANNPASERVLAKAGWTREGRLRKAVVKQGVLLDALLWAAVDETR